MERYLKKQESESLHQWVNRIAIKLNMTIEQTEAMREVAIECYIQGSNDSYDLSKKYRQ